MLRGCDVCVCRVYVDCWFNLVNYVCLRVLRYTVTLLRAFTLLCVCVLRTRLRTDFTLRTYPFTHVTTRCSVVARLRALRVVTLHHTYARYTLRYFCVYTRTFVTLRTLRLIVDYVCLLCICLFTFVVVGCLLRITRVCPDYWILDVHSYVALLFATTHSYCAFCAARSRLLRCLR